MKQLSRFGGRNLSAAVVAAVAAGALLLAVRSNAYAADKGDPVKAAASPLDYVPVDSPMVISLRVADYWNLPRYHAAREAFLKGAKGSIEDFRNHTSLTPDEIDRLTFFQVVDPDALGAAPSALVVLTTVKPYDQKEVLDAMAPDATKEKAGRRVYYVHEKTVVAFLDDHSFVSGEAAALKSYLSRPLTATEGPMNLVLKQAAEKHLLVAGASKAAIDRSVGSSDEFKPPKPLSKVQFAALIVDLDDALKVDFRFTFANDAVAKKEGAAAVGDAAEMARGDVGQAIQIINQWIGDAPKTTALLKKFQTALGAVKIEQTGTTGTGEVAMTMDPDALAAAVAEFTALVWKK